MKYKRLKKNDVLFFYSINYLLETIVSICEYQLICEFDRLFRI